MGSSNSTSSKQQVKLPTPPPPPPPLPPSPSPVPPTPEPVDTTPTITKQLSEAIIRLDSLQDQLTASVLDKTTLDQSSTRIDLNFVLDTLKRHNEDNSACLFDTIGIDDQQAALRVKLKLVRSLFKIFVQGKVLSEVALAVDLLVTLEWLSVHSAHSACVLLNDTAHGVKTLFFVLRSLQQIATLDQDEHYSIKKTKDTPTHEVTASVHSRLVFATLLNMSREYRVQYKAHWLACNALERLAQHANEYRFTSGDTKWTIFLIIENLDNYKPIDRAKYDTTFTFAIGDPNSPMEQMMLAIRYMKYVRDALAFVNDVHSVNALFYLSEVAADDPTSYDLISDNYRRELVAILARVVAFLYTEMAGVRKNSDYAMFKRDLFVFSTSARLVATYAKYSPKFADMFAAYNNNNNNHSDDGLRALISLVGDEHLSDRMLKYLKSTLLSRMLGTCYAHASEALFHLSVRARDSTRKRWQELSGVDVCARLAGKLGLGDEAMLSTLYMTMANVASDAQLERSGEMRVAARYIAKLVIRCVESIESVDAAVDDESVEATLVENDDAEVVGESTESTIETTQSSEEQQPQHQQEQPNTSQKRERDEANDRPPRRRVLLDDDAAAEADEWSDVCYVTVGAVEWNLFELTRALYMLSVNDSMKLEIYHKCLMRDYLKRIVYKGNEAERQCALLCMRQLCFDPQIANDVSQDSKFVVYMRQMVSVSPLLTTVSPSSSSSASHIRKSRNGKAHALGILFMLENKRHEADVSKMNSSKHVLISYNENDRAACVRIKRHLDYDGFRCWIDIEKYMTTGLQNMAKAVENCYCVVTAMSESYKFSAQSRLEAEYAVQLNKPIIPLMLQANYRPDGWLGLLLGSKSSVDFATGDFDDCIERLKIEIRAARHTTLTDAIDSHRSPAPPKTSRPPMTTPSQNTTKTTLHEHRYPRAMSVDRFADTVAVTRQAPAAERPAVVAAPRRLGDVFEWAPLDVERWLTTKRISKDIAYEIRASDGRMLYQLYVMLKNSPDFFSSTVRNANRRVSPRDAALFSYELTNLFNDYFY